MNIQNFRAGHFMMLFLSITCSITVSAQIGGWNPRRVKKSQVALKKMIEASPKLQTFKDEAYAYAVFPKITKAAIGIGGAGGRGIVFKHDDDIGSSSLKQATVGIQLGGQQYSEVIFFEDEDAYENFINGNLKFDAQASAVAITSGASVDVAYNNGVAVFTRAKGGLMYEASIGGQYFTFKPKE